MATLPINVTEDFIGDTLNNITAIQFGNATQIVGTFASNQFGTGKISNTVTVTGGTGSNFLVVKMSATGTFTAAGWTLSNWTGSDQVQIFGTSGADTIIGTDNDDTIGTFQTQNGADVLSAGGGNDFLRLESGSIAGAQYDGGSGTDAFLLNSAITYDFTATTVLNMEAILFGQTATAILLDSQIGAGKIAAIDGGGGGPQAIIVRGNNANLSGVAFTHWGDPDQTVTIDGSNLVANTLVGSSEVDTVSGGIFSDVITGGGGADSLSGGSLNDAFNYTAGSDLGPLGDETIDGGSGIDRIQLINTGSIDFQGATVTSIEQLKYVAGNSSAHFTASQFDAFTQVTGGTGVDALIVTRVANFGPALDLSGVTFSSWTAGTDTITLEGSVRADTIIGSNQNDSIDGKGGSDTMSGGAGDDFYFVNTAADIVNEAAGQGAADRVFASADYTLGAGQEIEKLTTNDNAGIAPITLIGNELANIIFGNAGSNALKGGLGNDTLVGLGGADAFVFNTTLNGSTNVDAISDFSPADDDIILAGNIFPTIAPGTLAASAFVIGTVALDPDDRIIYDNTTGALLFDLDGTGAGAAVQFATVTAGLAVTNADFIVV